MQHFKPESFTTIQFYNIYVHIFSASPLLLLILVFHSVFILFYASMLYQKRKMKTERRKEKRGPKAKTAILKRLTHSMILND